MSGSRKDWARKNYEQAKARVAASSPLHVASSPDQIAEGILYFVTGGDVITGECLIMDGGSHLAQAGLTKR